MCKKGAIVVFEYPKKKKILNEPSRTFAEYRILPGLTTRESAQDNISLETDLLAYLDGEASPIVLNIPLISAAMQSVTGSEMAIALAKQGGIGVIYCSQSPDDEAAMVRKVKRYKGGFVEDVVTVNPDDSLEEVIKLTDEKGFSTFPVVNSEGKLMGIITDKDYNRRKDNLETKVVHKMTLLNDMFYASAGVELKEANDRLDSKKKSCLPVVDEKGRLLSCVFRKDIEKHYMHPNELVDPVSKRLLVAAAVNTHDYHERVPVLVEAGADVIFIDASDGYSIFQEECIGFIKANYSNVPVIGGNVITREGFKFLAEAGVDGVKVGMGGGSICITQEQKGTGRGQLTAVLECVYARTEWLGEYKKYIPIISDGGIVNPKDVAVALAVGADSVMMGRYFARFKESPTRKTKVRGIDAKPYWGEGSSRAQAWSEKRYGQNKFEEGVDGFVPYAGLLDENLVRDLAKIKATMSSAGCERIKEFQENAVIELISEQSRKEGNVHDIFVKDFGSTYNESRWG
ncbi:IMP dehydrogenase [Candidatus Woesearchaeota archaeon]|nr:IMP dehydrogenase [Candidatus Woesearchaeota archaeon]